MYDRILVPTDGSEPATNAVRHASRLSDGVGCEVHLLSVVTDGKGRVGPGGRPGAGGRRRAARLALEDARERWEGTADVLSVVEDGSPPQVIVDYVREHDIDLIVMGTHGRTGLRRYLVGSVAEAVVRTAPVPVLVVGAGDVDGPAEEGIEATYAVGHTDPGVAEGVIEDTGPGHV